MLPLLSAHRIGLLHRNGLTEAMAIVGQGQSITRPSGSHNPVPLLPRFQS